MTEISVILPCFNVSKYLDRCMESLVAQTIGVEKLEIILVDDASTDDTWDIIRRWESIYPDNVIAVHCDINGRLGKARNIGLSYVSCGYVAFVDSDDWIEPTYFEKLYSSSKEYNCDMVCCSYRRDFSDTLTYFDDLKTGKDDRFILFNEDYKRREASILASIPFYAWGKLIRRDFLIKNELYFPERLAYEDNIWGPLLPFCADGVYFLEEALYHYYVNSNSLVLKKDADYHVDLLTVHLKLWDEYLIRGLYPKYKDEIEYNFLYTCALGFIKILANRYEHPSFSQYMLMRSIVLEKIPDYRSNRYIKNGDIKEFHLALIEMLYKNIDRKSFYDMLEAVKKSGM